MRWPVVAALSVALTASPAWGQSAVDGVEVWGGVGDWASGPASELPSGPRVGISVGGEWSDGRIFALEALYGRHSPEGRNLVAYEVGIGALVRQALGDSEALHPYLQLRIGWSRRSGDGARAIVTQHAAAFGAEVGVATPVSDRVQLLAGLAGTALWHADERADRGAEAGTGGLGLQWGLRAGLRVLTNVEGGGGATRRDE